MKIINLFLDAEQQMSLLIYIKECVQEITLPADFQLEILDAFREEQDQSHKKVCF